MRKQYKKKKKSCALCKPHKMAKVKRWKSKDFINIKKIIKEDYEE